MPRSRSRSKAAMASATCRRAAGQSRLRTRALEKPSAIVARRTRSAISSLLQVTRNRLISNAPQTRGSASAPCNEVLAPEHRPPSTKRSEIPAAWSWLRTLRTSSTRQDSYVLSSVTSSGSFPPASPIPGRSSRTVGIPRAAQRRASSTQARLGPVCGSAPELSRSNSQRRRTGRRVAGKDPERLAVAAGARERTLDHAAGGLQLACLAHSRGPPGAKRRPGLGHRGPLRQPVQHVCDGRLRHLRLLGFDDQSVVVARS